MSGTPTWHRCPHPSIVNNNDNAKDDNGPHQASDPDKGGTTIEKDRAKICSGNGML